MPNVINLRFLFTLFWLLFGSAQVLAYIPAQPTNSSQEAIEGGLNVTDISKLYLRWYPNGYYSQNVSYQLAGYGSTGTSEGALVHFSEAKVNNMTPPTTTPWIAMVSCDFNATNMSTEEDIFTLARDKGAVAALLYSAYSLACVINPEYADPDTFDQVFDIFSTQSLTSASLIQYQFGQFGLANESIYGVYDSQRLNDSASMMNTTLQNGTPPVPGYLFAILQAYNSTVQLDSPSTNNSSQTTSPPSKQNTNLAMIILYAITGCVSGLFCIVIITGAIRAIRHPERYGPRTRGRGSSGQSRARGLTRAILDTFPIVKFGTDITADPTSELESQNRPGKNSDPQSPDVELKDLHTNSMDNQGVVQSKAKVTVETIEDVSAAEQQRPAETLQLPLRRPIPSAGSVLQSSLGEGSSGSIGYDVVPTSIGREICPICIMDFEEGDNLRLLPCEGKHRFHQSCVDPWLLELSSSCPICRQDFLALENIISGRNPPDNNDTGDAHDNSLSSNHRHRLSRYLRLAQRRHRRSAASEGARNSQLSTNSSP